jgi:hypothetical protein
MQLRDDAAEVRGVLGANGVGQKSPSGMAKTKVKHGLQR